MKQVAFAAVLSGLGALSACGATENASFSNDGSVDSSGGTGGSPGSSTGGVRATGGASSGGATASGGTVSTGGATESGGTVSTGGATESGGTVSTGGTTESGGTTASGGGAPGSGGQDSGPATCVGVSTIAEAFATIEHLDGATILHRVPCAFALPAHTGPVTFDPTQFNVGVNSSGSAFNEIGHVASSSDCVGDGWYFGLEGSAVVDAGSNATRDASTDASLGDASVDPGTPAFVVLCPHTCSAATASPGASVAYLLGCPTLEN